MQLEALEESIYEAQRFLKRAKKLRDLKLGGERWFENPIENGEARRASMDLTRSLARLRRS